LEHLKQKDLFILMGLYLSGILLIDYAGLDIWLAKILFQYEGMAWSLKHHWLTENVIHKGGRLLNYIGVVAVLALTIYWRVTKAPALQLKASLKLCLSLALSFICINYLKTITNIDCPWDLSIFGGDMPYIHLLADKPDQLPLARCFPAGHASAGYAWISLYYFFSRVSPRWKWPSLIVGITLGLVFGLSQQLRGAHFLSHDLTTLFLCWFIAFCVFNYVNNGGNEKKRSL